MKNLKIQVVNMNVPNKGLSKTLYSWKLQFSSMVSEAAGRWLKQFLFQVNQSCVSLCLVTILRWRQ